VALVGQRAAVAALTPCCGGAALGRRLDDDFLARNGTGNQDQLAGRGRVLFVTDEQRHGARVGRVAGQREVQRPGLFVLDVADDALLRGHHRADAPAVDGQAVLLAGRNVDLLMRCVAAVYNLGCGGIKAEQQQA